MEYNENIETTAQAPTTSSEEDVYSPIKESERVNWPTMLMIFVGMWVSMYSVMDVLPWMCATDQRVARAMHAHLIRHKTISSGDNCCEYWYVGDTSPESLVDSGSK